MNSEKKIKWKIRNNAKSFSCQIEAPKVQLLYVTSSTININNLVYRSVCDFFPRHPVVLSQNSMLQKSGLLYYIFSLSFFNSMKCGCKEFKAYSVVSIKRTGSLNYFEGFYYPDRFFHVLKEIFLPP